MPVVLGLLNGIIRPTCLIICCCFEKCDGSALDRQNLCVIIFMPRPKRTVRIIVKVLCKRVAIGRNNCRLCGIAPHNYCCGGKL